MATGAGWRAGRVAAACLVPLAALAAFGGARAAAEALPALHASQDREIRDTHNRQVLLRGINVTALTDQFQVNRRLPPVAPLRPRDYRNMEAYGFDVMRLALTWSKLEPRRGHINNAYVDRVAQVVQRAANHGMYTVIDMHNGGWGKYVATPPGEKCPRGLRPSHGWLGAPEWATFTDGKTTCHNDRTKKRTDAVKAAWLNFWTNHKEPAWGDGHGIQDHLVDVWGKLGRRFAGNPNMAGYDLLNEPDPGEVEKDAVSAYDGRFYADGIGAIRQAEGEAGGFPHIVLFEPNLTWSGNGLTSLTPDPGFSGDPNLVFSPHIYGRDVHTTQRPIKAVKRDLKREVRQTSRRARAYGTPLWIGEWNFSIFDRDAFKKLRAHVRLQDARQLGSAWWPWKLACGAPETFDTLDPKPTNKIIGNINPRRCPGGKPVPLPKGWRSILARAYPRYSPGTLTDLHAIGGRISLKGRSHCGPVLRASDPRACKLVVWIPKTKKHRRHARRRGKRPRVEGRQLSRVHIRKLPGGWLVTATVGGGAYALNATR